MNAPLDVFKRLEHLSITDRFSGRCTQKYFMAISRISQDALTNKFRKTVSCVDTRPYFYCPWYLGRAWMLAFALGVGT